MKISTCVQWTQRVTVIALVLLQRLSAGGPYDKAVNDFFESPDPFIQNTVIPNIDKFRKADARIRLTNTDGSPLAGATISLRQFEHQFLFGSVPPFEEKGGNTSELFKKWRTLFNFGIAENAFKWSTIEAVKGRPDFHQADWLLDVAKSSGAQLELHFLTGYLPVWANRLSDSEKASLQRKHALSMLDHFSEEVKYIQVFNEILYRKVARAHSYVDPAEFFSEISTKYPRLHFGVSDCWPWNPPSLSEEITSPSILRKLFPGIAFVAVHGHSPQAYYTTPKQVYKVFQPLLDSGLKAQISEFGIANDPAFAPNAEIWTEELRAKYFVSMCATVFSHPSVEAFNFWGMGPRINRWNANQLVGDKLDELAPYKALESLLRDKLMTSVDGRTDDSGVYAFRGFQGRYEVVVELNGEVARGEIVLTKPEIFSITLQKSLGTLEFRGGSNKSLLRLHLGLNKAPIESNKLISGIGQEIVFLGLATIAHLEIQDARFHVIRSWNMIGERIEWNPTDETGKPLSKGIYAVRAITIKGVEYSWTLFLR